MGSGRQAAGAHRKRLLPPSCHPPANLDPSPLPHPLHRSFVLTLKKGRYTYQFGQYAWTHMILMVRRCWIGRVHVLRTLRLWVCGRARARAPTAVGLTPPHSTMQRPPARPPAQVVFLPSSFFVSLLFEGIIWFLLPTTLVIVNDIMAYLAGAGLGLKGGLLG